MAEGELQLSLEDTLAMLRRADVEIYKEAQAAIAELGKEASELAKAHAEAQGFAKPGKSGRGTGRLLEKIGYSVHGPVAILRETAVSAGGYKYPAIFEFSRSYKGGEMSRPFLFPAIDELEPEAFARVQEAVDRAVAKLETL